MREDEFTKTRDSLVAPKKCVAAEWDETTVRYQYLLLSIRQLLNAQRGGMDDTSVTIGRVHTAYDEGRYVSALVSPMRTSELQRRVLELESKHTAKERMLHGVGSFTREKLFLHTKHGDLRAEEDQRRAENQVASPRKVEASDWKKETADLAKKSYFPRKTLGRIREQAAYYRWTCCHWKELWEYTDCGGCLI